MSFNKVDGTKHRLLTSYNPPDWAEVSVSIANTDQQKKEIESVSLSGYHRKHSHMDYILSEEGLLLRLCPSLQKMTLLLETWKLEFIFLFSLYNSLSIGHWCWTLIL